MASALDPRLDAAIRAYVDGDTTIDDLRCASLAHLQRDHIEQFLRAIPSEAAADFVRWLRIASQGGELINIGNFATEPSQERGVRDEMIRYVGDAAAWFSELDLAAAIENVRDDSFGDWYRDPWGWPELSYLGGEGRSHVLTRALREPVGASIAIDVPKSATRTRPAVVLDIVDRVLYQACVDSIAPAADRRLKDWVFGWRVTEGTRYASNQSQWRSYFRRLHIGASTYGCGWHTDISDFFASISLADLDRALAGVAPARTSATILAQAGGTSRTTGRSGIPQRSTASSVLANLLLAPLDEVAAQTTAMPARWLDDVWIFTRTAADADRVSEEISAKIVDLGFQPNPEKTLTYEGAALVQAIDRLDFAYIDSQLEHAAQTPVLRSALELLIASPERAARHEISFVTSRIKRYHRVDLAQQLAEYRMRFAHVADLVAPVLLKSGVWRELIGWCSELLESRALPWVKTSFLRMYPRSERWPRELVDSFAEASAASDEDSLVRVTALSRVSKLAPAIARDLFEAHTGSGLDPMLRRAFAAVATSVGVPRRQIRRFLLEDDRTVPFAEFLASVSYQHSALRLLA